MMSCVGRKGLVVYDGFLSPSYNTSALAPDDISIGSLHKPMLLMGIHNTLLQRSRDCCPLSKKVRITKQLHLEQLET